MKNYITLALILITISLTSCSTASKTIKITEVIEGAEVKQDKSFRSLSKWDYSVEFKDGSRRSATVTIKLKYGINPMDIANNAVERLFSDRKNEISFIQVKPHSDMYGLVLKSNSKQ